MAFETIVTDLSSRGVASIIFNRPDRGNALSSQMLGELIAHLSALANDPQARLVILRANGKHFCSGADVAPKQEDPSAPKVSLSDFLQELDQFPKPVICVVQGGAIGAGAALASCCDVTLADPDAFFSVPEVRLGIVPGGVVPVLLRALGPRNLRRYALSGERIKAPEAKAMGLVHEVHRAEEMEAALAELTEAFLLGAPGAQALTKAQIGNFDNVSVRDMKQASQHRAPGHGIKTPEAQEGIAAFKEKRKPNWYVAQ
jgi:methylglutaconyl-CoA hydratase